jgi:hypothetical protein
MTCTSKANASQLNFTFVHMDNVFWANLQGPPGYF